MASAPNLLSNRVGPAWINVVPTMRKCWHMFVWQILCSSWLTAGLLLDAGSALAKGGQVMFRPQPLHQLPKLPSHVLSEGAPCLEPPPLKILSRRKSGLSLHRLLFTASPGFFFSNIYWWPGAHGIVDFAPNVLSNRMVPVWFNVVPTMPKCWHMLVSLKPKCVETMRFPCGSTWFQR